MQVDDCCFCQEIIQPSNSQFFAEVGSQIGIVNRILRQNDHWIVIPTIGALTVGYLLLVTREHYLGMAEVPSEVAKSLFALIRETLETIYQSMQMHCVVFEHGATEETASGSNSVSHCHLHIVPVSKCLWNDISNTYAIENSKKFASIEAIYDYLFIKKPSTYLYFMDIDGMHYVIDDDLKFPSQFFRKVIADELGLKGKWNWKQNPLEDNLLKTFTMFANPND